MSSETTDPDKQKSIAQAAFQVFAEHGFRKTSMQLIAQKAGMSRPALYLHFQSKEDVFRFLAIGYLTKVADSIDRILAVSGPATQVLQRVFDAFDPDGIKAILLDAKHGDELMAITNDSMKDAADKIAARINYAFSKWLEQENTARRIVCDTPELTARTIMSSYEGLKTPLPTYAEYKARTSQLARLLGKGLQA